MLSEYILPRATPESQGVSSSAVHEWLSALKKLDSAHSYMIVRHGHVISEGWWNPYSRDVRHKLFSLSKSFTSMAIGLAVEEKLLKLDDKIPSFFPEHQSSSLDERFSRMTVRHLLTMSSGHKSCAMDLMEKDPDGDYLRGFFRSSPDFEPGSRFVYNSGATYMLSAIITKLTGQNLVDYLNPRLLHPLGIQNAFWDACPKGISLGGWGFYLATDEIAHFSQMLLQKGMWRGKQLVPAQYIEEASSFQIDNSMNENPDWKLGYGFQFWRSQHNSYRADGAFGQYGIIMPEQDMIIAMTSGMSNMQAVLTLIWELLLKGVHDSALPEDCKSVRKLNELSLSLSIPIAEDFGARPDISESVYLIEDNPASLKKITLASNASGVVLCLESDDYSDRIIADYGKNRDGITSIYFDRPRRIAASAAWKSSNHLEVVCVYYETPFIVKHNLYIEGDSLRFESSSNLRFRTNDWPTIYGKMDQ